MLFSLDRLQAGGNQVKFNAAAIGATIESRIEKREDGTNDYQCLIRDTVRSYSSDDNDNEEQGLFTLEILVEQLVHVTFDQEKLSFPVVAAIVETGFNRGQGGRLRFKSLLRDIPAFADIVNIEVLEDISSPQEAPSSTPSDIPSDLPSIVPTIAPTEVISLNPTLAPSNEPTIFVPVTPSIYPSVVAESQDRQPLIIIAIAGGLATILVSLFFIFCVWYPVCMGRKSNQYLDSGGSSESDRPVENQSAQLPSLLTFEDDSFSLANTSVTLGDKSFNNAIKNHSKKNIKSTSDDEPIESFDESSVYTSTEVFSNDDDVVSPASNFAPTINESHSSENPTVTGIFDPNFSSGAMPPTILQKKHEELATGNRSDAAGCELNTKGFDPFKGEGDDESSFGFNSNGFDAEEECDDDESSFGFGSSIAMSDPSFGQHTKRSSGKVSLSSSSTKTKRIHNVVVNIEATQPSLEDTTGKSEATPWCWADNHSENNIGDDILSMLSHSASADRSSNVMRANDVLLRRLLEGATTDVTKDIHTSSKSTISMQSAPSGLLAYRARQARPILPYIPPRFSLIRNLADFHDTAESVEFSSSRSVGGKPRSEVDRMNTIRANFDMSSLKEQDTFPSGRPRTEKSSFNLSPPSHVHRLGDDTHSSFGNDVLIDFSHQTASGQPLSVALDERTLGARPRVGKEQIDSSSSHSSRTEDKSVTSTNELKSTHSVASFASFESNRSRTGIDRAHRRRIESPQSFASTLDSRLEEYKSADSSLASRSLEQDLSRLRTHRSSSRGQTIASSVTESSFGGSRSTLSSIAEPLAGNEARVVVFAPPGKIDVVLTNRHDGRGTFVAEVRPSSSLRHKLSPGDKLGKTTVDPIQCFRLHHISYCFVFRQSLLTALMYRRWPSAR